MENEGGSPELDSFPEPNPIAVVREIPSCTVFGTWVIAALPRPTWSLSSNPSKGWLETDASL